MGLVFHKQSSDRDSKWVLGIGVATLFLCFMILVDPATVSFFLFSMGSGCILVLGFFALICYLFGRGQVSTRRDVWLDYFLVLSLAFGIFAVWFLVFGTTFDPIAFVFGGIPYSLFSIALGAAMSSRSLGEHRFGD